MAGPNSGSKDRKKGDWQAVQRGRMNKERDFQNGKGLSAFPPNEPGSAAYRRIQYRIKTKGK